MRWLVRHLATAATLGNALAGLAAISLALLGGSGFEPVLALVALGLLLDGIDGRLARRFGSVAWGARLDAVADLVSFVALPAVLLATSGAPLVAAAYALAGLVRLARFAASAPEARRFRGLPASVACGLVVLALALALAPALVALLAVGVALLMLSPVPYPMMREGLAKWLWPFVALIAGHALVVVALPAWRAFALQSAFVVVLIVLVAAPFVVRSPAPAPAPAPSSKT